MKRIGSVSYTHLVYQALIKPGDTVMGLNLAHGGHLTHGSPVNQSGILYNFVPYNINDDGVLDYDEIRKLAHECKPKMCIRDSLST